MNRALALKRRKVSPRKQVQSSFGKIRRPLWKDRWSMARLSFSEAKAFIHDIAVGQPIVSGVQPFSVLLALTECQPTAEHFLGCPTGTNAS